MHVAKLHHILYHLWKLLTIPPSGYGGVARKRNFVIILPKFGHKTIDFMQMRKSIFMRTIPFSTDICVKNQSKTPHRLRARGDNNNNKKKKDRE
jgi:hypothetical protein